MAGYRLVADAWRNPATGELYKLGDELDPPAEHLARLIKAGALVEIGTAAVNEPVSPPDNQGATAPSDGGLEKPKKASPVDDWRLYAIDRGYSEEQAEAMTKAELIEKLD